MIDITELIIGICSVVITSVLVPLITAKRKEVKTILTENQLAAVEYWTEVGVRWAKQWLQTSSGKYKKAEVVNFLNDKLKELKIPMNEDDIDKIIESVYEQVKAEV